MLIIKSLPLSHVQSAKIILDVAIDAGLTTDELRRKLVARIDQVAAEVADGNEQLPRAVERGKRRPDNITTCSVCGKAAVIVPVNTDRKTRISGDYTHGIQCQNRPATDQPWRDGMCGHTEYVVWRDR